MSASSSEPAKHDFKPIASEPKQCAFIDGNSVCSLPLSALVHSESPAYPRVGDEWEFRLPHMKSKRVKEVGSVVTKGFIAERGTYPKWEDKIETLPYVNWKRENKGRYTGITVRRLLEFGRRISTLDERRARYAAIAEKRKQEREDRINSRCVPVGTKYAQLQYAALACGEFFRDELTFGDIASISPRIAERMQSLRTTCFDALGDPSMADADAIRRKVSGDVEDGRSHA